MRFSRNAEGFRHLDDMFRLCVTVAFLLPMRMGKAMRLSTVADVLERCARDLHSAAFDFREPRQSIAQSERLIEEVERVCAAARAAVRG